jgi:hypothetical protein
MTQPDGETLLDKAKKPVLLARTGRLFIGDDEFTHPIAAGSIKLEPLKGGKRKHNLLTMTLIVGEVTMEAAAVESDGDDDA